VAARRPGLGIGFIGYIVAWIAMPKDFSPAPAQTY